MTTVPLANEAVQVVAVAQEIPLGEEITVPPVELFSVSVYEVIEGS
jgi:hypothetical protein